jgi:hypothetical protein
MIEALKALQYEGTKSEVVQGFKDQGNEAVKAKKWADAKEFYTKGIVILNAKEGKWDKPKPEEVEEEERKLLSLRETVHVNRALCQLELSMFRTITEGMVLMTNRKLPLNITGLRTSSSNKSQEHQSPFSQRNGFTRPRQGARSFGCVLPWSAGRS